MSLSITLKAYLLKKLTNKKAVDFDLKDTKNVLFMRYDRIGDMLISTPVFREFKLKNPNVNVIILASNLNKDILINNPEVIGIYRISMKANSTNFRYSSTIDILDSLKNENVKVMIYEPLIKDTEIYGCSIEKDLNRFKEKADLIISNRIDDHILDVIDKVYSRDIFKKD